MSATAGIVKALGERSATVRSALIDFLYPPVCLACNSAVDTPQTLCPACWRGLDPISAPMCPRLGLPFAVDLGPAVLSAEAIANPPPYDRARAAVRYGDIARRLVSRFKYADRTDLVHFCARLMVAAGHDLLADNPVLLPVPLHWQRRVWRRYNQSALLAREIARRTGLTMLPQGARRVRATRQQVGLSAKARARNVSGAFRIDAGLAAMATGRPVLIIDDVVTTGATVAALARALGRAGIANIDVLSFARVVGTGE